jgi:hypothetical protein
MKMERQGAALVKKVKVLSRESEYNKKENSNLEEMIKNLDKSLQQVAFENLKLKEDMKSKLSEKDEEVSELKRKLNGSSHPSSPNGSSDLFTPSSKKKKRRFSALFGRNNQMSHKTDPKKKQHSQQDIELSDKITEKLQRLIAENQKLRKENERLKDSWIQNSQNGSGLILGYEHRTPGESLFKEPESSFASVNAEQLKADIYASGKKGERKSKAQRVLWSKKEKTREQEANLRRTTLKKGLEQPKGDVGKRYSEYAGMDEREKYCALI